MKVAFFGSSLVSSYWNGAATYYRGLLKALAALGHAITFYAPDAYDGSNIATFRIGRRPLSLSNTLKSMQRCLDEAARHSDVLVKASGVGVLDAELETTLPELARPGMITIYWDVDAPATLDALEKDPLHHLRRMIPRYDLVLTYGGGEPVVNAYGRFGARHCEPIYNALDAETHHPVAAEPAFACELGFLGNRLPDREARVEEFFLRPAAALPTMSFLLGGSGWERKTMPGNVRAIGHVGTASTTRSSAPARRRST